MCVNTIERKNVTNGAVSLKNVKCMCQHFNSKDDQSGGGGHSGKIEMGVARL